MVPIASENQNTSLWPPITKGMSPATVDSMAINRASSKSPPHQVGGS